MKFETMIHGGGYLYPPREVFVPVLDFCCKELKQSAHENFEYDKKSRNFWVLDTGGQWIQELKYCPFCGRKIDELTDGATLPEGDHPGLPDARS